MFRKTMVAVFVITALILPTSRSAQAVNGLPTWQVAFDPGPYLSENYYLFLSLEEFKNDLYAVAGDPRWLHPYPDPQPEAISYGQVFRSADGKDWETASEIMLHPFFCHVNNRNCGLCTRACQKSVTIATSKVNLQR